MKNHLQIIFLLISFPLVVNASGITLKDGSQIECQGVWEEGNDVKCFQNGRISSYPKNQVSLDGNVSPQVKSSQNNEYRNVEDEQYEKPKIVKSDPMPAKQKIFIQKIEEYYPRYLAAPNQLKKSDLRTERKNTINYIMDDLRADKWIGVLKSMGTTSQREAYIVIQLPNSKITLRTNSTLDFDNTLIKQNTKLYETISNLEEGDKVVFSGTFIPDREDYLKEFSITELGSMTEPEFIFRFIDIQKLKIYGSINNNKAVLYKI